MRAPALWFRLDAALQARAQSMLVGTLITLGLLFSVPDSDTALAQPVEPCRPAELLDAYFQALLDRDTQAARGHWREEDTNAAERLGIRFSGGTPKYDSTSPMGRWMNQLRAGTLDILALPEQTRGDLVELPVLLLAPPDTLRHVYSAVRVGDCYKLASPFRLACAGLPSTELEFVRVFIEDESRLNPVALGALDRFILDSAQRLGFSSEQLGRLRLGKIDYLVGSEEEVRMLAGAATEGVSIFAQDAVVSQRLCHFHELAHILMNMAVGELPLYTHPLLQEGAAVALGGRWGRSPEVILELGRFILDAQLLALDDLLTLDGFRGQMTDLSYAPAGLFCDYLLRTFGHAAFIEGYRALSAELELIAGWDATEVQARVANACGVPWSELAGGFRRHVESMPGSSVKPLADVGPSMRAPLRKGGLELRVRESADLLEFEIRSEPSRPEGALLFRSRAHPLPEAFRSRSFDEQLDDVSLAGSRFGLVFSPEEIGWYDYATDVLVAKFIRSMAPADVAARAGDALLRYSVPRELLPGALGEFELELHRR